MSPTIGVLGGASNVATGHFYTRINALSNARLNGPEGGFDIVQTLIAGMNFGEVARLSQAEDWDGLSEYVEMHLDRLGSADLIVCVSNTLHKVFVPLMESRGQDYLHIVDPTAEAILAKSLSKVALFGTKTTMTAPYAIERYKGFGIDVLVPTEDEQGDIHRIIFDELCQSEIKPESRERYVEIANRLRQAGAQGLILGCTEIETLLKLDDLPDMPLFDTMENLCRGALDRVLR